MRIVHKRFRRLSAFVGAVKDRKEQITYVLIMAASVGGIAGLLFIAFTTPAPS